MSHVDEGTLHAWLDGALAAEDPASARGVELHVAACEDCAARLEEARRLRDDADAILIAADPDFGAPPPFEAVRRRAGGGGTAPARRTRRRGWVVPVSWAATVVLAVGLGWMLRDETMRDVPESGISSSDLGAVDAREVSPPPSVAMAEPAPQAVAGSGPPTAGSQERQPPAAAPDRRSAAASPAASEPASRAGSETAKSVAAPAAAPTRSPERLADAAGAMLDAVSSKPLGDGSPARDAAAPLPPGWVEVSREQARTRVAELAEIPGLTPTAYAAPTGGAGAVLIRQRLPQGGVIDVVQLPSRAGESANAAADELAGVPAEATEAERARSSGGVTHQSATAPPAAAPPPPSAAAMAQKDTGATDSARVVWRGTVVSAAGPIPLDSIRALLRRLPRR